MDEQPGGFLSRWAQRKAQARAGVEVAPEAPVAAPPVVPTPSTALSPEAGLPAAPQEGVAFPGAPNALDMADAAPAPESLPTLADVALLSRDSSYARFVARGVDEGVKRAAMKKLFTDPHFNVMDGLDTYIADYGQPDPIPLAMLRQMNQSKILRLFDDEEDDADAAKTIAAPAVPAPVSEPVNPCDDDSDLRLQQDDAAGRPGPGEGTRA
jgi:hypothetical protein